MSRQSARKVKLTSKFEEFSTSRLASISHRLAAHNHNNTDNTQNESGVATAQIKVEKAAKAVEREAAKVPTPAPNNVAPVSTPNPTPPPPPPATTAITSSQRIASRVSAQKAAPVAPSTPVAPPSSEPHTPIPYSHMLPLPKLTANGKIRGRPRKCWQQQKAETVVKPMSSTREELLRLREEVQTTRVELEAKKAEFEELKRQSSYTGQTVPKVDYDDLKEKYQRDLIHAKRHEWCKLCLQRSKYHCCWNTTYCSQKCQVTDWYKRHMKSCERRKAINLAPKNI